MERGRPDGCYWQEGARHAHDDWWGWPLHAIFFLLLVALLVVGVVWAVRRLSPNAAAQAAVPGAMPAAVPAPDPAVAALRMRYANGEVSRDDFQNAMADLTGTAVAGPWPGDDPAEGTAPTAS